MLYWDIFVTYEAIRFRLSSYRLRAIQMSTRQIALVVASTGIVGKNLVNHLARTSDWTVYGLARSPSMEQRILPSVCRPQAG
ncbi:hypothetical protein [Nostoc sp.]|uniref:hypothetical protein n=1 Tax=Nostoc sp. TaxID=1180 RepID=UPI002FFD1BD4